MRHIIVLGAADTRSDQVPVWLLEHGGHTLIENIVGRCENLGAKIIFAMQKNIARKYHLDSIAKLASPSAKLVEIDGLTQGAACTALLCVEEIDLDDELLIMSANEVLEMDLSVAIENFKSSGSDAGVITFASLHPRYSYVALGSDDRVIQAAEKHPISRKAIAGFFWFAKANEFVSAAQDMIRKDVKVDDQFFISLTLNELILKHKVVTTFEIEPAVYKPLKSDRQIQNYEMD